MPLIPPAFIPLSPILPQLNRTQLRRERKLTRPRPKPLQIRASTPDSNVPNSPETLVRSWADSRKIASTLDLSRRFISVLFLSNRCMRAAYAEKQLCALAEQYSISRRLLILSAGVHSRPGDLLPWKLIDAARRTGIDLSEEQPCAAFDISDLEYYDFVVAVDRNVKDYVLHMAEAFAQESGGHLYEWERKVRLLCDFDGTMPEHIAASAGTRIDVPCFGDVPEMGTTMQVIDEGCEAIVRSLVTAGV